MMTRTTTTGAAHPLATAGTTAIESIDTPPSPAPAHATAAVSANARRLRAYALGISAAVSSRIRTKAPRPSSIPRALTVFGWAAVIAVCGYVGLTAMVYFAQRSLMYFPDRTHTTPAAAGLPEASEVPLTASDGVKIHVWQVPPQPGKPVILYFHGNGGSLRYRVERFRRLIGAGIGLVALEYRGYGGLSGNPTERGLIRDAEAAYAYTAARYPTPQIVVWGESLGTGVAVALAAEKPVGRLILEAPFTSALAIAESRYWYLPVRLLMKDQFRSDERIKKVTAPLLILHGVNDRVVPFSMGEHMFELANKPKHIVRFLDGSHEDLDQNGALDAVARFLAGDLD
ncbi:MAG: alpha/beta hydrolase [Xanthobacteraceae bacterium]